VETTEVEEKTMNFDRMTPPVLTGAASSYTVGIINGAKKHCHILLSADYEKAGELFGLLKAGNTDPYMERVVNPKKLDQTILVTAILGRARGELELACESLAPGGPLYGVRLSTGGTLPTHPFLAVLRSVADGPEPDGPAYCWQLTNCGVEFLLKGKCSEEFAEALHNLPIYDVSTPAAKPTPVRLQLRPTVVVERGDTLWGLAVRYLGSGRRWEEIFKLNAATLEVTRRNHEADGWEINKSFWLWPETLLVLPEDARDHHLAFELR
jgi:hypothetical protein